MSGGLIEHGQSVPAVDSTANLTFRDVVGNKEDTKSLLADVASLVALARMGAKEAWEVDHHFHTRERWLGLAGEAEGFVPYAIPVDDGGGGAGTWGAWTEILDADDTPIISGSTHYDPHRILVVSTPIDDKVVILQFAWGAVAGTAYSNGDFTETRALLEKPVANAVNVIPVTIHIPRLTTDTLLWCRAKQDAAVVGDGTVDFYIGLHEYTDLDV